jgi:hypothetical protein
LDRGGQVQLREPRSLAREDADRGGKTVAGGVHVDAQASDGGDVEPEVDRPTGEHPLEVGPVTQQR